MSKSDLTNDQKVHLAATIVMCIGGGIAWGPGGVLFAIGLSLLFRHLVASN